MFNNYELLGSKCPTYVHKHYFDKWVTKPLYPLNALLKDLESFLAFKKCILGNTLSKIMSDICVQCFVDY
jgi:hypothetical protein